MLYTSNMHSQPARRLDEQAAAWNKVKGIMWHRRLKKQWKSDGSLSAISVCMGWEYRQLKTRGLEKTVL